VSDLALVILAEMRQNAAKALEHAARGGDRWHEDDLVVDAVANRVRQLTELAKYQFPEDEKGDYPQVPWDELARARDFYTHHYDDLDVTKLRATVEGPLRAVLGELERLQLPDLNSHSA
jgi:uncharacterized protein with HEPN domain